MGDAQSRGLITNSTTSELGDHLAQAIEEQLADRPNVDLQAGTFLLDQLTTYAKSRGAVVRLLGDDRQLPAVDSGGALRLLAREPGTPQLTTLYRFRDPTKPPPPSSSASATPRLSTGTTPATASGQGPGRP